MNLVSKCLWLAPGLIAAFTSESSAQIVSSECEVIRATDTGLPDNLIRYLSETHAWGLRVCTYGGEQSYEELGVPLKQGDICLFSSYPAEVLGPAVAPILKRGSAWVGNHMAFIEVSKCPDPNSLSYVLTEGVTNSVFRSLMVLWSLATDSSEGLDRSVPNVPKNSEQYLSLHELLERGDRTALPVVRAISRVRDFGLYQSYRLDVFSPTGDRSKDYSIAVERWLGGPLLISGLGKPAY